ncbi:hypothetical protein B4U37_13170 [Sutcliffiella horikoshii]|uniref:Ribosomal protein S14 n=1 Tax=Sutcliffiella horikoshii TaxID=79883 RepID=A0ABN4ZKH4_9BACI|nr:hypothetical protein B4U37_13170 [Sutcliffiella horikoshii]
MLRPRNEVRRLKVAPRKAKPFAEIKSGVLTISKIKNFFSGLACACGVSPVPSSRGRLRAFHYNQQSYFIHRRIKKAIFLIY